MTGSQNRPVAVITGGGSGLGLACAEDLATDHRVVILGRRRAILEAAATRIGAHPVQADASSVEDVERAVAEIVGRFERVDVLVNAAGGQVRRVTTTSEPSLRSAHEVWQQQMDQNATSAFLMCYALAPHLTRPGGRIVNFSSIAALRAAPTPGGGFYAASKCALHGLSMALARELSPQGITVNLVAPGLITGTDLTDRISEERLRGIIAESAVGRAGRPEEIASAVRYLVGPNSGFITGQVLVVDGGAVFGR